MTEETIEAARAHFSAAELAQLVYAIAAINAWNRLAIADRTPRAHLTPRLGALDELGRAALANSARLGQGRRWISSEASAQ